MTTRFDRATRIGTVIVVAAIALASWLRPLDASAAAQVDQGLKAALATFATARLLNGVISVIQSTQVGMQVGVGASVQPAEALDPLNDLIETFSDYMLAATVAFGVQKVLLSIGAHWAVSALLTVVAATWVAVTVARRTSPRWLARLLVLAVLIRFAVPIAALGTDVLSRVFLAPTQEAAQRSLDGLKGSAGVPAPPDPSSADAGTIARLKEWLSRGGDLPAQVERFTRAAGRVAEEVTDLIVVFLLRTLVFPLAFLWLAYQAVLALLRPGARSSAPPGDVRDGTSR